MKHPAFVLGNSLKSESLSLPQQQSAATATNLMCRILKLSSFIRGVFFNIELGNLEKPNTPKTFIHQLKAIFMKYG